MSPLLNMRRYVIFIAISAVIILLAVQSSIKTEERTQLQMGTFVKITLQGPRWLDFDTAFKRAFAAVDNVDAMASIYNNSSEVSQINNVAHLKPVVVSDNLFRLINDSLSLSRASGGSFDITVAPLVRLWESFKDKESIPPSRKIKKTLSRVGYDKIILDDSAQSLFFPKKGMALDLSAIAKGYAVDSAVEELKKSGFKSAIVNAGGDLYCLGKKNFFQKWRIGIINPYDRNKISKVLYLSDTAVATSGGYEQYFTYEGKDYPHLIDPRTGYPVEMKFFSVTVVGPRCTLADGIATAVSVGGESVKSKLEDSYHGVKIVTAYEGGKE